MLELFFYLLVRNEMNVFSLRLVLIVSVVAAIPILMPADAVSG